MVSRPVASSWKAASLCGSPASSSASARQMLARSMVAVGLSCPVPRASGAVHALSPRSEISGALLPRIQAQKGADGAGVPGPIGAQRVDLVGERSGGTWSARSVSGTGAERRTSLYPSGAARRAKRALLLGVWSSVAGRRRRAHDVRQPGRVDVPPSSVRFGRTLAAGRPGRDSAESPAGRPVEEAGTGSAWWESIEESMDVRPPRISRGVTEVPQDR